MAPAIGHTLREREVAFKGNGVAARRLVAEAVGDDAIRPVRSDDDARLDGRAAAGRDRERPVHLAPECGHRVAIAELSAGSLRVLHEEGVQSPPLGHVGEGARIVADHLAAVADLHPRACDHVLHHRLDRERQEVGAPDGDTAATRLVARELGAVQQQHARTSRGDLASSGAPGRPGTDDDDIRRECGHASDATDRPRAGQSRAGAGGWVLRASVITVPASRG